jgi:hypothetical protein
MSAFRPFGAPFIKVFLGAIFSYQLIYFTWMKLETWENKKLKNGMYSYHTKYEQVLVLLIGICRGDAGIGKKGQGVGSKCEMILLGLRACIINDIF